MNKAFLMIGIAIALLGACSGDQRSETSGATGPISPWHSLTEAEVQEVATAVMGSTDDAVVFNRTGQSRIKNRPLSGRPRSARRGRCPYRSNQQSGRAQYDFQAQRLSATVITSGQPMLAGEEIFPSLDR